mgnify:CR=1 FL=1
MANRPPPSRSHLSWVRGLKPEAGTGLHGSLPVAPLMGAWIETLKAIKGGNGMTVAPLMGAWIETIPGGLSRLQVPCRTSHGCVD